jgi:ATP-dependent DNA ligase
MKVTDFRDTLDRLCATTSRKDKKAEIRKIEDTDESPEYALTFISGEKFDDAGLGKKTVLNEAQSVYGDAVDGQPTLSESLEQFDAHNVPATHQDSMESLYHDMEQLAALSGKEQKAYLRRMLKEYHYPSIVSHACLDDLATGCSDKTIANALDLRDSLPFYDSVVDAASAPNPVTKPVIHNSFDPMLAVPESRGRPESTETAAQIKVDGYRCIIHISEKKVTAYSRRGNDITESLPELSEIHWPDGDYIIDCEVVAETGSYSDTSERIGRDAENVTRDTDMIFCAFDMIDYNNQELHNKPYKQRYKTLLSLEQTVSNRHFKVLGLKKDIENAKDAAAKNGHEGIIVKDMNSKYNFGKRSSKWQKVKLDDETVDVRITDFVEGEGRLSGTLGKVAIESADGVNLGYSGSGFTDEQRDKIWNNQDKWHNATIEVEARGLGTNNNLRMPIFKFDRRDDGEPDSFQKIREVMKNI